MDVQDAREGLASAFGTVSGLTCYDYIPDSLQPPTLFVADEQIEFDAAMGRGLDVVVFTLHVAVTAASGRVGSKALSTYLAGGAGALKAAHVAGRTLGGAVADSRLESLRGHVRIEVAGNVYLGAELTVRAWG